jgi:tRNA threonylcarbamoyladenosine biosynthesis protein TsaB
LPTAGALSIVNCVTIASHPRVLLIETSGRSGQVALARGENLLGMRRLNEARRHARDLAPALAELLREQGWKASDLDAVFVSRGPGSYTGLRVGIMSAKTLAYATGCILLGIDTFAVIAHQVLPEAERLDVLADAQQGKVYHQSFQRAVEGWQASSELRIVLFENWLAQRNAKSWVSGPALAPFGSRVPETIPRVAQPEPGVESLLNLGLRRYRAGERDDPITLAPLYLRPSAAEEQWKRRDRTATK